jgi:hypothetical protein
MGRLCTDGIEDLYFYSCFNLGARLRSVVKVMSRPFYLRKRVPVPISQENQRAAGLVWTHVEKRKFLTSVWLEIPNNPVCTEALY